MDAYDHRHLRECMSIVDQSRLLVQQMLDPYASNCDKPDSEHDKQLREKVDLEVSQIKHKIADLK